MMIKNYMVPGLMILSLGVIAPPARADTDVINPEKNPTPVDGRIKATSPLGQEDEMDIAEVMNPVKDDTPIDGRIKATSPLGEEDEMDSDTVAALEQDPTPVDGRIKATSPEGANDLYASNDSDYDRREARLDTFESSPDFQARETTISRDSDVSVRSDIPNSPDADVKADLDADDDADMSVKTRATTDTSMSY